jgi:hypothetical protein
LNPASRIATASSIDPAETPKTPSSSSAMQTGTTPWP